MSFSKEVKEELVKSNVFGNINLVKSELFGYLLTYNAISNENTIEFCTENEFNIERFYRLLFKLEIEYEPETNGKNCKAKILNSKKVDEIFKDFTLENDKEIVRGAFLGAGSVTEPSKSYHLEITFSSERNSNIVQKLCELKGIKVKQMETNNRFYLYIKDGEEISKFLAYIGANLSVMKFEDTRIMKEMKNNVNRLVNCETANLNKIVNASLNQVNDIKYIIEKNRFEELTPDLKEIAKARLENPDVALKDLGKFLSSPVGKSGINYRLKRIHEFAEDLRNEVQCED